MRNCSIISLFVLILGFAQCGAIVILYENTCAGTLAPIAIDGNKYITTDQIVSLGEGGRYFASPKFKESIRLWGIRIVFSPENPFITIDGSPYNMGLPTILDQEGLLVPLNGFFEVIALAKSLNLTFSNDTIQLMAGKIQAPSSQQDSADETSQSEPAQKPKPKGDKKGTIVIDAGHGGKDPGAIGPSGVSEKDIALAIAKFLRDELEALGFDAILTRYSDTFLPLSQRTQMANKAGADLFISIHCNASRNGESHGTQVFYLSPAKTDEARAVAALENQALLLEDEPIIDNLDELQYIMADMTQATYQRESSILAYIAEQSLAESLNIEARGPNGAGFYVLYGAFMPSILVEAAFISNLDEEKLLALPNNQRKIAKGITAGVKQFWENIRK